MAQKWIDKKGREFIVKKQDSYTGKIKLVHETADGKKKVVYFTGYELRPGLNKNLTTGFPEIDKILRGKSGVKKAEENHIEKAIHGIYEDNAENRRLNRVGQEYGHAAKQKEPTNKQPNKQEEAGGGIQAHAAKASDEALRLA